MKRWKSGFCRGFGDLLLIGLDTDTDSIRVHVPDRDGEAALDQWVDARELYAETLGLDPASARAHIAAAVEAGCSGASDPGMNQFIARLIENNISQIDYVKQFHGGNYSDAGHAERFIGVGIGFKEIHLRNLTYFAHLDTVEEGAPISMSASRSSAVSMSPGDCQFLWWCGLTTAAACRVRASAPSPMVNA